MINLTDDTTIHVFEGVKLMDIYDKTTGFPRLDNELRNDGADRDGDILNIHYNIESMDEDMARERNREIEKKIEGLREMLGYNGPKLRPERVEAIEEEIKNLLEERDDNTFEYGLAGERFNRIYEKNYGADRDGDFVRKDIYPEINDVTRFRFITEEMTDLYSRKNADYGDSFAQSLDEDGLLVAKIRMKDKLNRFSQLIENDALVDDETMKDTLIDLANYAVMTMMWLGDSDI